MDGVLHHGAVQYRQSTWQTQADRAGVLIGRTTEFSGAGAENLRIRRQLGMDWLAEAAEGGNHPRRTCSTRTGDDRPLCAATTTFCTRQHHRNSAGSGEHGSVCRGALKHWTPWLAGTERGIHRHGLSRSDHTGTGESVALSNRAEKKF